MAVLNKVQQSGYMDLWDIVKFQILLYCHLNEIIVSDSDVECVALLALNGESEITNFCSAACDEEKADRDHALIYSKEIYMSPQSVRNSINKIEAKKLILKKGKSKKKILVNPDLKLQTKGNIFVEIKFLYKDEA